MYTNGNMAENVNEKGYGVVTKENERITVKTTTMSSGQGHVSFNPYTLDFINRVIILRFDGKEMELEILFDKSIEEAKLLMTPQSNGKLSISMSKINQSDKKYEKIAKLGRVSGLPIKAIPTIHTS